ncbi:MAG: TonB-dependent receptor plug domain-containing protein, partial [Bacteroidaceae bacterium]|nr:TonB-dependent receptor plug domain-containing protein [Bacteroidaceae bacterium]
MNTKHIIRLFVCICLIVLALPAMAQKMRTFKGTVVDESGDPLIGASVKVVGASTGTITDIEGNFVIEVPAGKTIEISYVGYLPEKLQSVTPGARIMLKEDANQLEDVVVVGYGAQKKAHLTGAIETVPMDQIQDLSSGNLASTLSGMISGVSVSGGNARPGENATIYIRNNDALASVGGSSLEPLYVIDGYIYPNDIKVGNTNENMGATAFNNLDASEIESVSVLKDAAAAVYGARAANGVILVTTKRGSNVGAPKVSYRGEIGFTDEMARAKMLDAYQYGRLYNAVKAADPTNFQNLNNKL